MLLKKIGGNQLPGQLGDESVINEEDFSVRRALQREQEIRAFEVLVDPSGGMQVLVAVDLKQDGHDKTTADDHPYTSSLCW